MEWVLSQMRRKCRENGKERGSGGGPGRHRLWAAPLALHRPAESWAPHSLWEARGPGASERAVGITPTSRGWGFTKPAPFPPTPSPRPGPPARRGGGTSAPLALLVLSQHYQWRITRFGLFLTRSQRDLPSSPTGAAFQADLNAVPPTRFPSPLNHRLSEGRGPAWRRGRFSQLTGPRVFGWPDLRLGGLTRRKCTWFSQKEKVPWPRSPVSFWWCLSASNTVTHSHRSE